MTTTYLREPTGIRGAVPSLAGLCDNLFVSLSRSDQRRWGEAYVRGLVSLAGRKSIRRISEHIVGYPADQCLQQFVNQSPWQWEPVRLRLAQGVVARARSEAWVIDEVTFPKNGANSAGVAKQYVPTARRTINCQLAVTACLTTEEGSVPVNWRLMLPPAWDREADRRARAHVPSTESHRPRWQYVLDMIDEMVVSWDLTPPVILVDCQHDPHVKHLLRGLEDRGLRYAVRVSDDMTAVHSTAVHAPTAHSTGAHSPAAHSTGAHSTGARSTGPSERTIRVADLARMASRGRVTLTLPSPVSGQLLRSHFVMVPIPGSNEPTPIVAGRYGRRTRHVVAQWPVGRARPRNLWLTNLNTARLPELVRLLEFAGSTRRELNRMNDEAGLQHFEGRSFRGWHHHVTLASVAHAYQSIYRQPVNPSPARVDMSGF
ncbi:MAG TPA: IS701 family transposase [Pseudonocardiaceae bacterium]|nr:IS701 family transposase [Pseudonocardiaceae bacterium]